MTITHHRVTFRNHRNQEIVGVLSTPSERRWRGVVYLVPGFERQIYHYGPLADSFCRHGFATLRADLTNHVGASQGDIRAFTLASAAEDIGAVTEALSRAGEPVIVVATSLSARSAIRVVAEQGLARGLALLLPVVDVDDTVRKASVSVDLDHWRDGTVSDPRQLVTIVEHEIEAEFARAAIEERWCGIAGVRDELARIAAPIVAVCAREDEWVRAEDVQHAMSAPAPHRRDVVVLEATSHQLTKNPIAVRMLIEALVAALERMANLDARPIEHLGFEEVVETVRRDRRWAKTGYRDLSDEPARTATGAHA